jgi:hypothetical protein
MPLYLGNVAILKNIELERPEESGYMSSPSINGVNLRFAEREDGRSYHTQFPQEDNPQENNRTLLRPYRLVHFCGLIV